MKTKIVRIGNSQGIRIPKPLLEEAGLGEVVELRITEAGLVLEPFSRPRAGWAEAACTLAASTDGEESDPFLSTDFDESDWEW
jgi:antitoxin MazE